MQTRLARRFGNQWRCERRQCHVLIIAALVAFSVCWTRSAPAQETVLVAAASDLQPVLPELARRFKSSTGIEVEFSFGSSGNFSTQIRNGAPYDLFFSADIYYPRQLQSAGLVEPGTLYQYANGTIVLWAKMDSNVDVKQGIPSLRSANVHKIAIANPEHAPYGRAAVAALQKNGIYAQIQSKLVLGENVSQAAQFVESGNAQLGIIPLSLAITMKSEGVYAEIPQADYPPIEQACVILKSSHHKAAAQKFLQFLKSPEAKALLSRSGFSISAK
jgi:molybdate transport system substrate-binding protein